MAESEDQLNESISKSPLPGAIEAHLLESRLQDLARASRGIGHEQSHNVFLDFCKQATAALRLNQGTLISSPSASVLLDYLMHAMSTYVDTISSASDDHHTATYRRQALAGAFMLTGKKIADMSEQSRIDVCHAFASSIHEQTAQDGSAPNSKQLSIARRAAYRVYWEDEWVKDDDTSKSRMKTIKKFLQTEGYDPD